MHIRKKITYIYVPFLGFFEAGETIEATMEIIHKEKMKKENADKKKIEELQKQNPGKYFKKIGNGWTVSEDPLE